MRPMRIFVNDDRHVMAKHSAVYPTQEELTAVQNMVSHTERALKAVSDWINEQEKGNNEQPEPDTMETVAEEENKEGRLGSPTPGPQISTNPWPVKNQTTQVAGKRSFICTCTGSSMQNHPSPWSMEKTYSMKQIPDARKIGDY